MMVTEKDVPKTRLLHQIPTFTDTEFSFFIAMKYKSSATRHQGRSFQSRWLIIWPTTFMWKEVFHSCNHENDLLSFIFSFRSVFLAYNDILDKR